MTEGSPAVVREWRALAPGAVLLDGFHALKHALRFGAEVALAVAEDPPARPGLARDLAPDLTQRIAGLLREIPVGTLADLVPRPHPTGVAALAEHRPRPLPVAGRRAPLVVLEDPRDLGNVGAVVRLTAGAGAAGVVTTGTVDPWHPRAVRASAGLHFATAVARRDVADLPPGPLYALDAEGEDIRGVVIDDDALLAFGSERHGLSPDMRERATRLLALPMRPQVSSYNLATSVAMALYHWLAQPQGSTERPHGRLD